MYQIALTNNAFWIKNGPARGVKLNIIRNYLEDFSWGYSLHDLI